MLRPIALAAAALAVAALPATAVAKTTHKRAVQTVDNDISCYATVPAEGRGIVCTAESLRPSRKTRGRTPVLSLRPRGGATFGGRSDYGGYDVKRPAVLRVGDRWVWRRITCTLGRDGLTCLNRDDRGFNVGPAGYAMLD